jgi:hypothetical protein
MTDRIRILTAYAPVVTVTGQRPARRRQRKPTLISVARQAAKAGLKVARYEVDPDGKIVIVTGKPEIANTDQIINEWDTIQ